MKKQADINRLKRKNQRYDCEFWILKCLFHERGIRILSGPLIFTAEYTLLNLCCNQLGRMAASQKMWFDVEVASHTHRGYEKVYCWHNEAFWECSARSHAGLKMDSRNCRGKETGLAFMVIRQWGWSRQSAGRSGLAGSRFIAGAKKEKLHFLISLLRCRVKMGGQVMDLKLLAVKHQ